MNQTIHAHTDAPGPNAAASTFDRVVIGLDGTESGFDACRQIARLASAEAAIEAAAVVHLGPEVAAAYNYAKIVDRLQLQADEALARAREILGDRVDKKCLNGFVTSALIDELEDFGATLLAIGTHGHHRTTEIALGGPAGELLRKSPCSVLVARPAAAETFPRTIVVGHDGSPEADTALAVAEHLALRFGSTLAVITALKGKGVDLERVQTHAPSAQEVARRPVEALIHASRDSDLLLVGSRGLHGFKALGSVSERVAHEAGCSVLVVRW